MIHDAWCKSLGDLGSNSEWLEHQRRRGHTGPMPKLSSAPASWQGVEWLPLAGIKNLGLELGDGRQVHQHEKSSVCSVAMAGIEGFKCGHLLAANRGFTYTSMSCRLLKFKLWVWELMTQSCPSIFFGNWGWLNNSDGALELLDIVPYCVAMVCWKRKVAGGWPRNFLFMDLGYEDEEEFEDVAWPCPTCTNAYPAVADMRLEDLRGFKDHGNHGTKRITGPGCESITKIYIKYKHYKQSEYS